MRGRAAVMALIVATVSGCGPAASTMAPVAAGVTPPVGTTGTTPPSAKPVPSSTPNPTAPPPSGPFPIDYIALAGDGSVLGTDCWDARLLRVTPGGHEVVAGAGPVGFAADLAGDDGPAAAAHLACPSGVAERGDSIYLVDHANNRIRVIDGTGMIATIAGSGRIGVNQGSFSGDGGPAVEATLQEPTFIVFDTAGNLYFSDRDNFRVRRIALDGTISTVAGTGDAGYSGDGGPATAAMLDGPAGLAIDGAGNLYIADSNNRRIRRVDAHGTISTIAGAEAGTFGDPEALAIDPAGHLYIGDAGANVVRRIDADGTVARFAGTGAEGYTGDGGEARAATLRISAGVGGIALGADGTLFIADTGNFCIRAVLADGTITTYAMT